MKQTWPTATLYVLKVLRTNFPITKLSFVVPVVLAVFWFIFDGRMPFNCRYEPYLKYCYFTNSHLYIYHDAGIGANILAIRQAVEASMADMSQVPSAPRMLCSWKGRYVCWDRRTYTLKLFGNKYTNEIAVPIQYRGLGSVYEIVPSRDGLFLNVASNGQRAASIFCSVSAQNVSLVDNALQVRSTPNSDTYAALTRSGGIDIRRGKDTLGRVSVKLSQLVNWDLAPGADTIYALERLDGNNKVIVARCSTGHAYPLSLGVVYYPNDVYVDQSSGRLLVMVGEPFDLGYRIQVFSNHLVYLGQSHSSSTPIYAPILNFGNA